MKTRYPAVSIVALCATLVAVTQSSAQTYPVKTVRIVVPYAAGGPVDTVTRIAAQNLTRKWGQQVIVENRAGSGGALGTQAVVKAPPDAYTLLITNSGPITSYPHMRKTLLYDFGRDLAPISLLSKSSIVLVVHPSLPARSLPEFVALAKRHPATLTYATSGVGGVQHLAMVLLESLAGIDLIHVPYKGAAPAVVDVLSGQVPVQFNSVLGSIQNIKAGKLRALGVSTAQPSAALPGVPPIAKYYPAFEITSWLGMYAPASTPQPLIDQINQDIRAALNVPETKKRLNDFGLDLVVSPPAELTAYAQKESRLFGKLMAKAGIEKE